MSNVFKGTGSPTSPKAKWQKPSVRQLKAGAAETGTGTKGDADGGGNIHS